MHLQRNYNNIVEPFPFSTFHLLRTCNRLMLPGSDIQSYYNLVKDNPTTPIMETPAKDYEATYAASTHADVSKSPILDVLDGSLTSGNSMETNDKYDEIDLTANNKNNNNSSKISYMPTESDLKDPGVNEAMIFGNRVGMPPCLLRAKHTALPLPGFEYINANNHRVAATATAAATSPADFPLIELNRAVFPGGFLHRRQRGEKRPIPEEQKDDKYYERRKRNNEAAKKSRDARKIREDRIAFRAALLEQENSLLRAQVVALRDELQTMRQLISAASPSLLTGRNLL